MTIRDTQLRRKRLAPAMAAIRAYRAQGTIVDVPLVMRTCALSEDDALFAMREA